MITKPTAKRAAYITAEEHDCHHWLGRLAMCLAITSNDMPPHLKTHVRKTLDQFLASDASSSTLETIVREALERP